MSGAAKGLYHQALESLSITQLLLLSLRANTVVPCISSGNGLYHFEVVVSQAWLLCFSESTSFRKATGLLCSRVPNT